MELLDPALEPDPVRRALITEMNAIPWWHRIPLGNGLITPGRCFHGADDEDFATKRFGLPMSLSGQTVLDIGAWDGYFSFEAERRGAARVIASDISLSPPGLPADDFGSVRNLGANKGFDFARRVLRSKVEYINASIYNIDTALAQSQEAYPRAFDYVFFFGVLYHVREPLLALEKLYALTSKVALIETAFSTGSTCTLEFRPGFMGDSSNLWYPTISCLEAMLQFVGFKRIELLHDDGYRTTVRAER